MPARYYHKHPRNFANECDIVRTVTPAEHAKAEEQGYQRLNREEARRHIAWMNAENDAWGSGRAIGPYNFRAMTDHTHPEHDAYRFDPRTEG